MNEITKNILVNAAKSTNQNVEQTLELAAESLTPLQMCQVKTVMRAGITIDHKSVNELF